MTAREKKTTLGQHLIAGLREAVAYERGETTGVETRKVLTARFADVDGVPTYSPVRIVRLRESLEISQPVFASVLNVSADTVRSWEQGKRRPDGAAVRLLQIAEEHPTWLAEKVRPRARNARGATG